ncbi:glycosyltransferase family 4 protein [Pedobacter rhodius]|uniref:Glycosyltransferase family 4 protein n=1 Tax=Pedobacter rhodius TaxID=3004098 RepID=A0ABT4KSB4_9SPHI|nr:glycosyltransferase family 4 protein [Pedobacter sp. SJ11]MCZ4221814.1 glycosyltransferase family 4 protein [Pedobacter sp. SJ11]
MQAKVLFLTLKTFGFTGGIEKVCRTVCRVLYDLSEENILEPTVYSMYDKNNERDSRYLHRKQFKGFDSSRKYFVFKAFLTGLQSDIILLSHVHLVNIGYLIKKIHPQKKIYLIAHGIEVWKSFPEAKLNILKSLDKIICVSQFTADKIQEIHQVPKNKIVVLNNCLDPFYHYSVDFEKPQFLLDRYQVSNQSPILFSLSRVSSSEKYKGYDHNIEVLPALLKNHPKLVYLLAGKWDELEKGRLDKLIAFHKLEKHIRLIGFIDEAEVTDHFLLSDIFIMPSKKEGFGIVFIEAIASGLQVIAGNKDGSVDALKQGELGALVDPDDLKAIQFQIENFLDHPQSKADKLNLQRKCMKTFNYANYKTALQGILLSPTLEEER